jgi:hypothetical protein
MLMDLFFDESYYKLTFSIKLSSNSGFISGLYSIRDESKRNTKVSENKKLKKIFD